MVYDYISYYNFAFFDLLHLMQFFLFSGDVDLAAALSHLKHPQGATEIVGIDPVTRPVDRSFLGNQSGQPSILLEPPPLEEQAPYMQQVSSTILNAPSATGSIQVPQALSGAGYQPYSVST